MKILGFLQKEGENWHRKSTCIILSYSAFGHRQWFLILGPTNFENVLLQSIVHDSITSELTIISPEHLTPRIISYRFRLFLDPMNPCFRTQGMWFCILPSTPKGFKHTLKFVKPYWTRTMDGFQGTFKIWKLQIEFYSIAKEKDYSLLRTSKHMWPQIF